MKILKEHAAYFLLLIIMLTGSGFLSMGQISLWSEQEQAEEKNRPADLSIIRLTVDGCEDCFDIDSIMTTLKKSNVDIVENSQVSYPSNEATDLIALYNISKLPTLIISGEIEKENISDILNTGGERVGDVIVWTAIDPIYVDAGTGEPTGYVDVTVVLDESCEVCYDPAYFLNILSQSGYSESSFNLLDMDSPEGQEQILKYGIKIVPAILLSQSASVYPQIMTLWDQVGSVATDGTFVAELDIPPYIDLSSKTVAGAVSITYLTNAECEDCYDPTIHRKILESNYGIYFESEQTYDISSTRGAQIIAQFNIEQVPTILLNGDVALYADLERVWPTIGTTEDDGTYVFRKLSALGNLVYTDLSKN